MRYIRLGNSDLKVSRLGLDCYSLGIAQRGEHPRINATAPRRSSGHRLSK
jgi:aryl-alcohol dehydrogenase-like predicted oxidoreductase